MNQKTAKIIRKFAELKGIETKTLKREWLSMNESQKDIKRQEYLAALAKNKPNCRDVFPTHSKGK